MDRDAQSDPVVDAAFITQRVKAHALVAEAEGGLDSSPLVADAGLGVAHQLMAALVLTLATALAWRVRRV